MSLIFLTSQSINIILFCLVKGKASKMCYKYGSESFTKQFTGHLNAKTEDWTIVIIMKRGRSPPLFVKL